MDMSDKSIVIDGNVTNLRLPALVALISESHFHVLRSLNEEEKIRLKKYAPLVAEYRSLFKLFTILKRNFEQWQMHVNSLFTPVQGLSNDEMLELDRLQMNFQSSAKSLLDQFRTHWTRKFRGTSKEKEFQDTLEKLSKVSWSFAFFQDLRNFTQHCGLPVGRYNRNVNLNVIKIRVECDAKWLLKNYSRWEKSKLTASHGNLNLVKLSRDYYIYLREHFGSFVASAFAPNLLDAHTFFRGLGLEVDNINQRADLGILTRLVNKGLSCKITHKMPPKDLFGNLGIVMVKKA
jgi:hypothetical protein